MARRNTDSKKRYDAGSVITTPSHFGSHASMVVSAEDYQLTLEEGQVLCKDDRHFYITYANRLDNGLADPCRYSGKSVEICEKNS